MNLVVDQGDGRQLGISCCMIVDRETALAVLQVT